MARAMLLPATAAPSIVMTPTPPTWPPFRAASNRIASGWVRSPVPVAVNRAEVMVSRAIGVTAPVIPGLKVLSSQKQLASIPSNFHVEVPAELSDEVLAARPEHVLDIGVELARRQLEELLAYGVPSAHFYVMQSAAAIKPR